jgi:anti-sigma factor RsiW
MTDEDAELVALIDNELDQVAKGRMLTRLTANEALRKRYEELRAAGAPIAAAFDALVEKAPLPRLRAALPPQSALARPRGRLPGSPRASLRRVLSVFSWASAPQPGSR